MTTPLAGQKQIANDSELVIAMVGALGTDLGRVAQLFTDRLRQVGYKTKTLSISREVIPSCTNVPDLSDADEAKRIEALMDAGNRARREAEDNSVLALGAARELWSQREKDASGSKPMPRRAWLVNSIKHPDEVIRLRQIYPQGFYLLGVHCTAEDRRDYLVGDKGIEPDVAERLMRRDESDTEGHGQHTADAFHLADFFVCLDGQHDGRLKHSIWRIVDLLFGKPTLPPTFDEYAMFMAYSAALRSADLSRQVGAVLTRQYEILATGANDCPKAGGGLYWPEFNERKCSWQDAPNGRDYMRGEDSNKAEQGRICEEILNLLEISGKDERDEMAKKLRGSGIRNLTEYGRMVHAEMEALLCSGRNGVSTRGATLYVTTFPCHNCAKHIVAAGIERVVYVEPYPKSKALQLHDDSIMNAFTGNHGKVRFEPFVGVGPRRFFDLFSMELGCGHPLRRKEDNGKAIGWRLRGNSPRIAMSPLSYIDLEASAVEELQKIQEKHKES